MNSNIEVIASNLLGVRFDWLQAGFVALPLLTDKISNDYAVFTKDGALVLNKNNPHYDMMKEIFRRSIMPLKNAELKRAIRRMEVDKCSARWNGTFEITLALLKSEQTRRTIKAKGGK